MTVRDFVILATLLVRSIRAFPSAPGSCSQGTAVAGAHIVGQPGLNGALGNGLYELLLDGEPLDSSSPISVATGVSHSIELKTVSGSAFFRGFLLRLGGGPTSLDKTGYLQSDLDNVQNLPACDMFLVGSLAHTDGMDKTSIDGTLTVPEDIEIDQLDLEVTVVQQNDEDAGSNGVSVYYEEKFTFLPFKPTEAPSMMPSMGSETPSSSPGPSGMPSMESVNTTAPSSSVAPSAITDAPTVSSAPSVMGTSSMPSDTIAPSSEPSAQEPGSAAPSMSSEVPSLSPSSSGAPSVAPSDFPTPFPTPLNTANPTPTPFPTPEPTPFPSFAPVSSAVTLQHEGIFMVATVILGAVFAS